MNIIHIADFGGSGSINGIASVVSSLQKGQKELGNNSCVILIQENEVVKTNPDFHFLNSPLTFFSFIKEKKPDIVVFHSFYKIQYIFFCIILLIYNIPYLIEFHGGSSVFNMKKNHKIKKLANLLFFNFFVNHSVGLVYLNKQEFEDSIFKEFNVKKTIIPNGVYLPKKTNEYIKNEKIEIVYLSRIDIHHKGIDLLLKAIKILKDKGYSDLIHFSFYGNAKDTTTFIELLDPCSDIAEYKGAIWGEKKINVLQKADIFILTSRYEGMPMAILEAMACECPCIITKETNMADIITENNAGWITTLNPEDIAKTIETACKDYLSSAKLYKNNAYIAIKNFDWSEIVKESIKKYKYLIKTDYNEKIS